MTPWTVAHWAPPPMGFSRQEYWSGLPFSSPGDLPDSGIERKSPALQTDTLPSGPPTKVAKNPENEGVGCHSKGFDGFIKSFLGFPMWLSGKEFFCDKARGSEDTGWITGSGRSLGGENGNPLQYSYLRNPTDRGAQ